MPTIVVGVDGSPQSFAALRWAVEQAKAHGAAVRAVHAWQLPLLGGRDPTLLDPTFLDRQRHAAERELERILARVRLDPGLDGLEIEAEAIEGRPARVLVEAAREAEMLVVGSRGRGGFQELLLGSVSHQCAQHAACPVVIVRGGETP